MKTLNIKESYKGYRLIWKSYQEYIIGASFFKTEDKANVTSNDSRHIDSDI